MNLKNSENIGQIRYCKKCGCELASTSKRKLCENCRRKRNAKIREVGTGVLAPLGLVILFAPKLLDTLNENTSADDDNIEGDNEDSDNDENNTL